MKYFLSSVLITFFLLTITGCNRNTTDPPLDLILDADKLSVALGDSVAANDTIRITSNTAWIVDVPQQATWLKVAPLSGNGDGDIIISTTEENADSLPRSVTIEIKTKVGNKSVFIAITQSATQSSFFKAVFGGSGKDDLNDVIETSDGNFIGVGTSHSPDGDVKSTTRSDDVWIIKFDKNGNSIWSKTYGGAGFELGISIVKTASGNYLVLAQSGSRVGSSDGDVSTPLGGQDAWLLSIDDDGKLLWEKSIGGSSFDELFTIEPTRDGHYLLAGETSSNDHDVSFNHGNYDSWLVKIDDQGKIIWQKCFGGSARDRIIDAQQVSDGGYIFNGWTESVDGDLSDRNDAVQVTWFGKIDSDGNIAWSKYLETVYSFTFGALEAANGDYLFGGNTDVAASVENFHGNIDAYVFRLDTTGNFIWKKGVGGSDDDFLYDMMVSSDDRIVLAGYSKSADGDFQQHFGGKDAFIMMLNQAGNVVNNKIVGGAADDDAFRLIETSPKHYAFVGNTSSYDHKYPDIANNVNAWFGIVGF